MAKQANLFFMQYKAICLHGGHIACLNHQLWLNIQLIGHLKTTRSEEMLSTRTIPGSPVPLDVLENPNIETINKTENSKEKGTHRVVGRWFWVGTFS